MKTENLLIIDDEPSIRTLLARLIRLEGYTVFEAASIKEGQDILFRESIDLILTDVKLPDGNGIELVVYLKKKAPLAEVIVMTAYGTITDGVQAMKNGAFDYLVKGSSEDEMMLIIERALSQVKLKKKVKTLEKKQRASLGFDQILGQSQALKAVIDLAKKVATTDAPVLITGETGSGKELFAQAIHHESNRSQGHFVAINCSAIAPDLLESELFGYTKGAFTGAETEKKGLLEEAHNGTFFLDELGDMSLPLQAKLLRFLETQTFIKIGDTQSKTVNVRIIAATHKDLQKAIRDHQFREDLFYRLNTFIIDIPPLRERREDILLLAEYYLHNLVQKLNKTATPKLDSEFLNCLQNYSWPGNIRELKNIIERALILHEGEGPLSKDLFPKNTAEKKSDLNLDSREDAAICEAMKLSNQDKQKAAKLLGISLATLYRKLGK